MANSKYEYVRTFEQPDHILPNTWIVVRIDGRAFHRFSASRAFEKPNDLRAIRLMNTAAQGVLRDVADVVLGYGQSDEFSFVFPPHSTLFDRRSSKLVTTVVSTFTAYYALYWPAFFPATPMFGLKSVGEQLDPAGTPATPRDSTAAPSPDDFTTIGPVPTFDGRAVAYPTVANLRDYLRWRQADCHINNLYNTTFWALVQRGGLTGRAAEQRLLGTLAADKNEILFSQFGVNYNNEPPVFRKGSVVFRDFPERVPEGEGEVLRGGRAPDPQSKTQREKERKRRGKAHVVVEYVDIIEDAFWDARPWLLGANT